MIRVLFYLLLFNIIPFFKVSGASSARYQVLTGEEGSGPEITWVRMTSGPDDTWQMDLFDADSESGQAMMQLRFVAVPCPFSDSTASLKFLRYQLRIPGTGEGYDYRSAAWPGRAEIPHWARFDQDFIPRPARGTGYRDGFPNTCRFLGHVLSLRETNQDAVWEPWNDLNVLVLDRELWIATSRTKKDAGGERLADVETSDYQYVTWTKDDYRLLIDAGMNVFGLVPGIEAWLRAQPVFYRRGLEGDQPLQWPVDLYRSNFIGPVLYMDEPSCRMTGNPAFYTRSHYFTDFLAGLVSRVEGESYEDAHALENGLRSHGVDLGSMRVGQTDFVTWETRYSTVYYQCLAGAPGFVHEGRYQLDDFNERVLATTGLDRRFTAEEMFRYIFAILRGGTRPFRAHWGISIYGQSDTALNPLAVTLAYDMGARHIWYWTSDHGHHLPWPEQIALSRLVREHAENHPRPSVFESEIERDKLITIPYGYIPVLETADRKNCWDLWWVREMDAEKRNDASMRYQRLMRRLFEEVILSLETGEDFDIGIDGGEPVSGYKQVVHVTVE